MAGVFAPSAAGAPPKRDGPPVEAAPPNKLVGGFEAGVPAEAVLAPPNMPPLVAAGAEDVGVDWGLPKLKVGVVPVLAGAVNRPAPVPPEVGVELAAPNRDDFCWSPVAAVAPPNKLGVDVPEELAVPPNSDPAGLLPPPNKDPDCGVWPKGEEAPALLAGAPKLKVGLSVMLGCRLRRGFQTATRW